MIIHAVLGRWYDRLAQRVGDTMAGVVLALAGVLWPAVIGVEGSAVPLHALRVSQDGFGEKKAPSRLRPRPAARLTFAEASAARGAINLGSSVLDARGTLGKSAHPVKVKPFERPRLL